MRHRRHDCRALCGRHDRRLRAPGRSEQFLADLKARMARFELGLHPEKTRLIEFGRKAIATRRARGLGKPETFDFLGFTHYCATRRSGGGFVLGRTPVRKRMRAKLGTNQGTAQGDPPRRRRGARQMACPGPSGLDGLLRRADERLRDLGIPASHGRTLAGALMRRGQRHRLTWTRMKTIANRYLPIPRILHPWPEKRFLVTIQGRSPVR